MTADLFALYLRIPGPSQKLSPALAPHLRLEEVKKRYQLGAGTWISGIGSCD